MTVILLKLLSMVWGQLPNIMGLVATYLGKKDDNATTRLNTQVTASTAIVQSVTSADVALNTLKVQESINDSKWWVTAWEKPLLFYLCALHFGAVVIDTTFSFHWGIPKLPAPYDTYQGVVLLSDVIVMSTAGLTQKVVASIWK